MTYLLKNLSTDPYFNLAAEEYVLDHFDEETILLWRNDKAVVVGRNQNTLEEVNADYVKEHGIAVVRRLTGGGAVFHDLGNVNYTVIQKDRKGLFSDYAHFTEPVCCFLQSLGVDARLSGRNDLQIGGMKCCGNAQTRRNGKVMHHGCILFSADVADLSGALRPNELKLESKGVKSVRSRITNVASHLEQVMMPEDFLDQLYGFFLNQGEEICEYRLTEADQEAVEQLARKKYRTWEWNYGSSPAYTARAVGKFPSGLVDVRMVVSAGRFDEIRIFGDFFGVRDIAGLERALKGVLHREEALVPVLKGLAVEEYISGVSAEELCELLLS